MPSAPFDCPLGGDRVITQQQPDLWRLLLRGECPNPLVGYVTFLTEQTKRGLGLDVPPLDPADLAHGGEATAWIVTQAAVNPRIVDSVAAGRALHAEGVPVEKITFIGDYSPEQLHYLALAALAGRADVIPFHHDRQPEAAPMDGVLPDADGRPEPDAVPAE